MSLVAAALTDHGTGKWIWHMILLVGWGHTYSSVPCKCKNPINCKSSKLSAIVPELFALAGDITLFLQETKTRDGQQKNNNYLKPSKVLYLPLKTAKS